MQDKEMEIFILLLGRMIILREDDEQFKNLWNRINWQTSKDVTVVRLRY